MTAPLPALDILVEDDAWDEDKLSALAGPACAATLSALSLDPLRFEISILACSDARIADLNAEFRGKPAPTNVLSWPAAQVALPEGGHPPPPAPDPAGPAHALGDIAIAHGTCASEAAAQGKRFEDHLAHLLVHATLHLLGYDHIRDADAAVMEGLETRILATLGVPDPY